MLSLMICTKIQNKLFMNNILVHIMKSIKAIKEVYVRSMSIKLDLSSIM